VRRSLALLTMSTAARPVIVFVTHHLPWPAHSGGRLREAELLHRLSERFAIEVVAVSKVPSLDQRYVTEAASHGVAARVFAATSSERVADEGWVGPLARRHGSPTAREYLDQRLRYERETVVHVEGHYLLGLVPEQVRPTVLLVEHNIESALFDQRARLSRSPLESTALLHDAARTRRDEERAWRSVRAVGAVTDDDGDAVRTAVPNADVRLLPNGADHLRANPARLDTRSLGAVRLLFVAALGYGPNLDAARLLVDEVFPEVLNRCPDATLAIVGSDPPEWLTEAARHDPRLTVTGWVPDVGPWLDAAEVVICPLRVGGGVKIKVLEALARGCAIVATPVALQGLRHLSGGAVMECSQPGALAEASARLLSSPREREQLRARAAEAARALPSWDAAADALASVWNDMAVRIPCATRTLDM
jgi:glycosyltransferase involved in cell wall biosynthesis